MYKGNQTWVFKNKPVIIGAAAVVGPDESEGPLAADFDLVHPELDLGEASWEKAERKLMEQASQFALQKAGLSGEELQLYVGGDLLNQIISTTFAARTMAVPYLGVFGACSTSMESLAIAALTVDSGFATDVMAGTCSHNCTAEKQFRYPTEYGAQKPPTAQYTVTGAGAAVISKNGDGPVIECATIGKVIDLGITDPFNMGAAMAPAAADTIKAHFTDTGRMPSDYDLIVTGDLASVGLPIAKDLLLQSNVPMNDTLFDDCGLMIYDRSKQLVQAGGSGCACSAVVTYSHLLKKLESGEYKRVLVVATGALLSPVSFQQGESIPGIAHAVAIAGKGAK